MLLERLEKPLGKDVEFKLKEVVHRLGDVIDPVTGKPVVGHQYRDAMEEEAELYGANPNAFKYDEAQPRGRLQGKRDFSDKATYYKWHVFEKNDDYGLNS